MALEFSTSHVADTLSLFHLYKGLGERAMAQVADADLLWAPDPESNSIAIIVKHMAGNMRSRWTDFLTTDGEKPDRRRDTEFEAPPATRAELIAMWEAGWQHVFAGIGGLNDGHLTQTVYIRGEAHSVLQALNRQLCHYAYHVGQIVLVAKQRASHWTALTIPRNKSEEFTRRVHTGDASQR